MNTRRGWFRKSAIVYMAKKNKNDPENIEDITKTSQIVNTLANAGCRRMWLMPRPRLSLVAISSA